MNKILAVMTILFGIFLVPAGVGIVMILAGIRELNKEG